MQYTFTVQRVKRASFFEVTTSRSREDVNGFHYVTFGPGGKPVISRKILLSVSVRFLVSAFEDFHGFQEFLPRLSVIFLSGRGNVN